MFYFADWGYLFGLLIVPLLVFWYRQRGKHYESAIRFSSIKEIAALTGGRHQWKPQTLMGIKMVGLMLLILALARPQKGNTEKEFITEGIDIMLVLDISSSMRAVDFQPNRLEAAKAVAQKFIEGRRNDRIGLVVFAAESFLQCPLTIDYNVLERFLAQVEIVEEEYDGTAIGMAIANGINRLRESEAQSKVMILLSDGRNNAGELDPITAAEMAKTFDIKIHTIGAGTRGKKALYPVGKIGGQVQYRKVDIEIDEEVLQSVADITGGQYFRATDREHLLTVYQEISQMEKTDIKVKEYYNFKDLYEYFLFPGLLLISLALIMGLTIWRKTP